MSKTFTESRNLKKSLRPMLETIKKNLNAKMNYIYLSRHGCISDASLRRLTQRLRDVSDRAGLLISGTSLMRLIKDVSSEMFLRCLTSSRRYL